MEERVLAETLQRFQERAPQRAQVAARIAAGQVGGLDSPDREAARRARLRVTSPETAVLGLERVNGVNNLIEFAFLQRGTTAGAAVGRVVIASAADVIDGYGTGVLVAPRLLLTNNHVLGSAAEARHSTVELGYEESANGALGVPDVYHLEPDVLFVTDHPLDFTLVAVAATSATGRPLSGRGFIPLIGASKGKVVRGEWLNIIQHPDGKPKSLALRDNRLLDVLDGFLHYETDTAPGSSGSPVFNDQWELVALHHSGVPARDADGNILATDGRVWTAAMGESAVAWIANEGTRVSRIVERIRAEHLSGPAAQLRDDLLRLGQEAEAAPRSAPVGAAPPPRAGGGNGRTNGDGASSDTEAALAELAGAARRPYYDRVADQAAMATYYASTSASPTYTELSTLTRSKHRQTPRYAPARELYPWVDLHPDLQLRSLYTGAVYAPERFILEDARISAQRVVGAATREAQGDADALDLLEATLPYNCEHVVPQSWFAKSEPMRGDLHHLFACESGCNSFRGNIAYFDFVDFDEVVRHGCGRREEQRFEPSNGKGAAARATFYFLLRYPGRIGADELPPERIGALLAWHGAEPPGEWERHRNQAIQARQGNRNPFIDHPEWAAGIDLTSGIGTVARR